MLHALYILAFTALSVLAISNLIRNMMMLGTEARRVPSRPYEGDQASGRSGKSVPHPEMLDKTGRVLDEPLLVMRSMSLDDARDRLDALYEGKQPDNAPEED